MTPALHRVDEAQHDEPDGREHQRDPGVRLERQDAEHHDEEEQHDIGQRDACRHLVGRGLVQIGVAAAVHQVADHDDAPHEDEEHRGDGGRHREGLDDRIRQVEQDQSGQQAAAGEDQAVGRHLVLGQASEPFRGLVVQGEPVQHPGGREDARVGR
ncbi:hypothetical protein SDC9_93219 [bioreactor metagenome]|uniref:Uncharacterized protein n=1 Tax=bioreactor metagenome TaxID=1076179 RepID=A0A645A0Q9_9ZZZZ